MADDLLKTYREKRDFKKTAEPADGAQKRKAGGNRYLIQKHAATRLHFDLRLEKDGVLKSWAVTRGPSLDPADKRLAVRTEDHPLDYGDFEGTIPRGEYGGGTVMLWDEGTWEPLPDEDKLDEGKLKFRLDGARLKGNWMLVRIKNNRDRKSRAENWLLFKERDGYASTEGTPIVERALTSVRTGRTMEEIAEGNDEWTRAGRRTKEPAADADAPKKARATDASVPMPKFAEPMMATLVDAPPSGDDWIHEIKYDGYRAVAAMAGGRVKIFTRNGLDWTDRFAGLVPAIADLPAKSALLDGEVAVPGKDGKTDFAALQAAMGNEGRGRGLVYHLFDLIELDGKDLRKVPLLERKAKLAELLRGSPKAGPLLYSDHVLGHGADVFAHAEKMELEGIVSKRADSLYRSERSKAWLKVKTDQDDEFLVVGWEPSPVKGKHFAALLLATREADGLRYRGKVGTGFGAREQDALWPELETRAVKEAPLEVPKGFVRSARFVKPELVATVQYRGISSDDLLRQASFKGLRKDKGAGDVDALDEALPVAEMEAEAESEDTSKPARRTRGRKTAQEPHIPANAGTHQAEGREEELPAAQPAQRKRGGKAAQEPHIPAKAGTHQPEGQEESLRSEMGSRLRGNERVRVGKAEDNSLSPPGGERASALGEAEPSLGLEGEGASRLSATAKPPHPSALSSPKARKARKPSPRPAGRGDDVADDGEDANQEPVRRSFSSPLEGEPVSSSKPEGGGPHVEDGKSGASESATPGKSKAAPSPRPGGERSDRGAKRIDPGEGGPTSRSGTREAATTGRRSAKPVAEQEPDGRSPLTRPQQAAGDLSPQGRGEERAAPASPTRPKSEAKPDAQPTPPKRRVSIITIERDKDANAIQIEGVKVTNPNRVLFPDRKITKRQLIEFQLALADRILPHVAGRPLSLVRCPRGAGEDCFYQKHASEGFPTQFKPIEIRERDGTDTYLYIEDRQGLVAGVQMGALELHIWGSHVKTLEQPDRVVFDFDPDEDIPFQAVKDGAIEMRDRLKALGLESFCMTTGGKGLHVVVPVVPKHGWDHIRSFAEAMARIMAQEDPKRYLAVMSKAARKGRIFIDYLRNGRGATAIAPYSTRARKGAPISWPVTWKALDTLESAHPVSVDTYAETLKAEKGDPWRGYFEVRQVLPLG